METIKLKDVSYSFLALKNACKVLNSDNISSNALKNIKNKFIDLQYLFHNLINQMERNTCI